MAETPTPTNKEAFKAFLKEFNLDPLNKDAINNCLFELFTTTMKQQEQIDEIAKNTFIPDFYAEEVSSNPLSLFDKWNNK